MTSIELLFDAINGVPFWTRALVVLTALACVGAVELALCRGRAQRWKEYAAWLTFAALGALFGAANDLITSGLSPSYFELGKGLPGGSELRWAAIGLGARAGTAAGLLIGGILLMANNPGNSGPPLTYRRLATVALVPFLTAALGAPLLALGGTFDLQGLGSELAEVLSGSEVDAFCRAVLAVGCEPGRRRLR